MEPKKEFIYILTNPSFTGMVKIGRSKDVAKRLKTFETGVPTPFKCEYCCEVEDAQRVENAFKVIFRPYRIKGKEFYEILPYQAAEVLRLIGGKDQAERFNAEEEKQIPVQSNRPSSNLQIWEYRSALHSAMYATKTLTRPYAKRTK